MKHITYNLLVWKWIDEKFDIKWMYLLCFIFVDTAFLLCGAEILKTMIKYMTLYFTGNNEIHHFVLKTP